MKYLLDTHILLWWLDDDRLLSKAAHKLIENTSHRIVFSSLSLWEIAIKSNQGKLEANAEEVRDAALEEGFGLVVFDDQHALEAARLPSIHADPFDRGLVATARVEGCPLLTADSLLARYGSSVKQV
ncbi:MAG: type II toxin-antitoxin system VapC family toxin [Pleurocapsa sp. SU_196_0]|nr:type II toxin-antitoxin system VapC family toxin [Pleurocapsa sp. SU_196_0]